MSTEEDGSSEESASSLQSLQRRVSVPWAVLDNTGPIQKKAKKLRSQEPVDWSTYLDEGILDRNQCRFLTAYQEAGSREAREKLLGYFQDDTFTPLVLAVQRIQRLEDVQKFLVLVDDMFWEDRSRIRYYRPQETHPWTALFELLSSPNPFVRNITSRIINRMITQEEGSPEHQDLHFFFDWLIKELKVDNKYLLSIARCLQGLMRMDVHREPFLRRAGLHRVLQLLEEGVKAQAQYQFVFCLWLSTFNAMVAEKLSSCEQTIPVLVEVLEGSPAEVLKTSRVVVATLRNLLEKPSDAGVQRQNALLLIQLQIPKFTQVLLSRQTTANDPEHLQDIQAVESILQQCIDDLSTFEMYRLEVRSRRLEWSVVHTCKGFWRENAHRLNENEHELVRTLVSLLEEAGGEPDVLCVAAHDLGQYVRRWRGGKKVVAECGGKDALVGLLAHDHQAVKYQALKALQILMLNNYDLLLEYVRGCEPRETTRHGLVSETFGH